MVFRQALSWGTGRECDQGLIRNSSKRSPMRVRSRSEDSYHSLMAAYQALACHTFRSQEVHGRSILDSIRKRKRWGEWIVDKRSRPVVLGIFFFGSALLLQLLDTWIQASPRGDHGNRAHRDKQHNSWEMVRNPSRFLRTPACAGRLGRTWRLHRAGEAGLGPADSYELRGKPDARACWPAFSSEPLWRSSWISSYLSKGPLPQVAQRPQPMARAPVSARSSARSWPASLSSPFTVRLRR